MSDPNFGGLCAEPNAPAVPQPVPPAPSPVPTPTPAPTPTPTPPAPTEICDNRIDDDGDGLVDCADPDCAQTNLCRCQGPQGCPCDLLQQNCPAGELCWVGGTLAAQGQCYPVGPKTLGQACQEPPVGGPDACAKGLICVADSATASTGSCLQLCGAPKPCPADHSCKVLDLGDGSTPDWGVCVQNPPPPPPPPPPPCDIFAQACPAGQMCVAQDAGANQCVAAGKGKAGDSCFQASECSAGLQCAGFAGTTPPSTTYFAIDPTYLTRGGLCLPVCLPKGAPSCAAGSACSPVLSLGNTRTDIGICY